MADARPRSIHTPHKHSASQNVADAGRVRPSRGHCAVKACGVVLWHPQLTLPSWNLCTVLQSPVHAGIGTLCTIPSLRKAMRVPPGCAQLVAGAPCGQAVVETSAAGRHNVRSLRRIPGNIITAFSSCEHIQQAAQGARAQRRRCCPHKVCTGFH